MGYEYKDEELELKVRGKVYKFRQPSAMEQKKLGEQFKEAKEGIDDAVEIYIGFFEKLGLPRDVLESMSFKGLVGLLEYSNGIKKN